MWEEECHKRGLHNASLQKVINHFIRTRLIFSSLFYLICIISGYLSSVSFSNSTFSLRFISNT
jgi:hypothetical protein